MAGPISRAPLASDELRAMALPRSSRSSTICPTKICRRGASNALTRPWNTARARISPRVTTRARVRAARTSDWAAAAAWVHTSSRRRSIRSIQTPAKGARTKVGISPAKPTTPSSSEERVRRQTSQVVAIRVIQVPMIEMPWPAK